MTPTKLNEALSVGFEDDTGAGFGVWLLLRSGVAIRTGAVFGQVRDYKATGSRTYPGNPACLMCEDEEGDCTVAVDPDEIAAVAIDWAPITGTRTYAPGRAPEGPFSSRDPGPMPPLTAV